MDTQKILERIEEKFTQIDQNPDVHLEGLVWANPITYWDYILPDALLNLQVQKDDIA
jgi:tryptophan 2,3-dioxygenase